MATRIMVQGARLSYPKQLWQPAQFDGAGDFYWSSQFLLDPSKPAQKAQIDAYEAAEKAEFKKVYMTSKGASEAGFEKAWTSLGPTERGLRDGDLKGDEYEGMMFLAARATQGKQAAPVVLDRQAARVEEGAPGAPYGGCYVNVQVEIWAQYGGKYKRTNCTLLGVQFVKDGDAFGGGKPADLSAFQALADTGEDGDGDENDLA